MKTHYILVDLENLVPESLELLDREWVEVLLFVGKNQTKIPLRLAQGLQRLGPRARYIVTGGTGPNALDFHIACFLGRLMATDEAAAFHVVSCDKGFDPLVAHLKATEGADIDRVEKLEAIAALAPAAPTPDQRAENLKRVKDSLAAADAPRPRLRKALDNHVRTLLGNKATEEEAMSLVKSLVKEGFVKVIDGRRLKYADEA